MRATGYAVPLLVSCLLHAAALGLSPEDPFRHPAGRGEPAPVRLKVVGPPRVITARNAAHDAGEKRPAEDEARRGSKEAGGLASPAPESSLVDGPEERDTAVKERLLAAGPARHAGGEAGERTAEAAPAPPVRSDGEDSRMASVSGDALSPPVSRSGRDAASPAGGGDDGAIVEVSRGAPEDSPSPGAGGGITTPPVIASMPEPEYPEFSRRRGEEGVVMLEVAVDEQGRGLQVDVLRSSGHGRLDRAAVSALSRARFFPAKEGGRAVSSVKKIAVRFSLKEAD
ncbi:MAG: TonB family protein [Deltaproteobacteria bacterium]|nr:TonB family protein [Deltaproteobacteria bacterium]NIS76791.1 TonB family protein [Deltaproteobacteria bacterium]